VCSSSLVLVRVFSRFEVRMFRACFSAESLEMRSDALVRASCVIVVASSVHSFRAKASVSASMISAFLVVL